jgi:hypothetical protein
MDREQSTGLLLLSLLPGGARFDYSKRFTSSLALWFDALDIRPRVVGEFDDSELRWEFGATGIGVFSAPLVLETHLSRLYNVQRIGWAPNVLSTFYAISVERKLKHPAAVAICEAARHTLFAKSAPTRSRRARARPPRG